MILIKIPVKVFLDFDEMILKFICHDNGLDVLKHFKKREEGKFAYQNEKALDSPSAFCGSSDSDIWQ